MERQAIFPPCSTTRVVVALFVFLTTLIGLSGCGGKSSDRDNVPTPDGEVSGQENPVEDNGSKPPGNENLSSAQTPGPESAPTPKPESSQGPEPTPASPPGNFRVELDGNTAIFRWDPVEGAESYTLYIAEEQGITPDNYASYRGGKMVAGVTSPYHLAISRENSYFSVITATRNGIEGSPSAELGIHAQIVVSGEKPLTLISVTPGGGVLPKSKGGSQEPAISYYGRYVAFSSFSNQVVTGDNNNAWDIFVYDRKEEKTTRVSIASNGTESNGDSRRPSISGNGQLVVFQSAASNLVDNDTNGVDDIFLHDTKTGETQRISVSGNGSQANGKSDYPVISSDGRFIAFRSAASNLVENDTNGEQDIFLYERDSGKITRISISSDGEQGNDFSGAPSISSDGRYIAFRTKATNLHPKGINEDPDILIHDRLTRQTEMVSLSSAGQPYWGNPGNPSISADGRYVVFQSTHDKLVSGYMNWEPDIFLHDRMTGKTTLIPPGAGAITQGKPSTNPAISGNGQLIVFQAARAKLLPDATKPKQQDVFLYDRESGKVIRISTTIEGEDGNKWATRPVISGDGSSIAFQSTSSNLVERDDNGSWDIFVFDKRLSPSD